MLINHDLKEAKNRYYAYLVFQVIGCLLLVAVIAALYATSVPMYTNKARMAEVFTNITVQKSRITAEYSQLGRWPNARVLAEGGDYGIIKEITFDGHGVINVSFNDSHSGFSSEILSFTAAYVPEASFSHLIWVCGYAIPPEGYVSIGRNITNMAAVKLPRTCKNIETKY